MRRETAFEVEDRGGGDRLRRRAPPVARIIVLPPQAFFNSAPGARGHQARPIKRLKISKKLAPLPPMRRSFEALCSLPVRLARFLISAAAPGLFSGSLCGLTRLWRWARAKSMRRSAVTAKTWALGRKNGADKKRPRAGPLFFISHSTRRSRRAALPRQCCAARSVTRQASGLRA